MVFPTDTLILALMKLLGSSSTTLGSSTIGLISAAFNPARNLTLASLTEANYDGYARQSLGTPSITFTGADGNDYLQAVEVVFTPTGSTTPNTIYGYFVTMASSSATLGYVEQITPPVNMNGPTKNLTIVPRIGQTPAIAWGAGSISY